MTTAQWMFTSNGEPAYYEDGHGNMTNEVMPGYRPGTVTGSVQEADVWSILVATKFWLRWINKDDEFLGQFDWEDYLWKVEAETHFLYDDPKREGFDPSTQRIVSGAFGVTDELNWMGFVATFSHDTLHTLALEVDTEWRFAVSQRPEFSFNAVGDRPKEQYQYHE